MSALRLQIDRPATNTGLAGAGDVALEGTLTGAAEGLFFKWYSSLNAAATQAHPELNAADHSAAVLRWKAPLAEFGTHAILLAAADRDGNDLASIQAITRSAMAGGAPPAPQPCLVHRVVAQIRTPASDGLALSRSSATIEVLAPVRWAKEEPPGSNTWVADGDYQAVNGIGLSLTFEPTSPDPAHTATMVLALATLPLFRADAQTWLRWTGALPAPVVTGSYTLTLTASGGGAAATTSRQILVGP